MPEATPTILPNISRSLQTYAQPGQLLTSVQTLRAEKVFSLVLGGKTYTQERWKIVFRQPDDGLLEVYDRKGNLERIKYFHGRTTQIDSKGTQQVFQNSVPQARSMVIRFLDLSPVPARVTESRELIAGLWVPNTVENDLAQLNIRGKRPALGHHTLAQVQANIDVTADFAARGH